LDPLDLSVILNGGLVNNLNGNLFLGLHVMRELDLAISSLANSLVQHIISHILLGFLENKKKKKKKKKE